MPIVTELGIHTAELCENSKKYLSRLLSGRLLVGAQIKNPNLISWEEIFNIETNEQAEDLSNQLYWQLYKNAGYNGPLDKEKLKSHSEEILKPHIIDKLNTLEYQHHEQEYLKPYHPEFRKQQEDIRCKKRALISIAVLIGLAIGFPFALPLLGSVATLVGMLCLATGATLICCSIIPAFFGERLIDPEWLKEYSIEKEKYQKKITAIKATNKIEVIREETEEQNSNLSIPVQQTKPLTAEVATQTTSNNTIIAVPIIYNLFVVPPKNPSVDFEQKLFPSVKQAK